VRRPRLTPEQRDILINLAQCGHVERFHANNDQRERVYYDMRRVHDAGWPMIGGSRGNVDMSDQEYVSAQSVNGLWRRQLIDCTMYGELQWIFTGNPATLDAAIAVMEPSELQSAWPRE
jgi:hypothetical protein